MGARGAEDGEAEDKRPLARQFVRLAGGRVISYLTAGPTDGVPVIALHGTPGSRLKFTTARGAAHRHGIRLIAPDRWGYGGTSIHPAPSLAAFAEDMTAFADHLGLGRMGVIGISGGGPYAAAVASLLPGRVMALALVAPVGLVTEIPLASMTTLHQFCFGPLTRSPTAVAASFGVLRRLLALSPAIGISVAMARVSPADRRVLAVDGIRSHIATTFADGLGGGLAGPVIDLTLFGKAWNVDVTRAGMPARLWLGTQDRNVPRTAALRLAARLPACELIELEGAGHLWIAQNHDAILSWIAGHAGRGSTDAGQDHS